MGILFFTNIRASSLFGGVEKITTTISKSLRDMGYNVYNAYLNFGETNVISNCFDCELHVKNGFSSNDFIQFLRQKHISKIICQNDFDSLIALRKTIDDNNLAIKLIFVHHMTPLSEVSFFNWETYSRSLFKKKSRVLKDIACALTWKIRYQYVKYRWIRKYREISIHSDRIILLCDKYTEDWVEITDSIKSKFLTIPNPNTYTPNSNNYKKKNVILVIGRLEESQTRISKIIKYWGRICFSNLSWTLKIVGTGPDLNYYKYLARKNKISNIEFCGYHKNPIPFYQEASILLMTSRDEGWPLTLLEAQQFGCVPIVYDSFKSLSECVGNGYSGYIIPNDDDKAYINCLQDLINDRNHRLVMSDNACEYSNNFNIEKIIPKWVGLINS